jgi:hypothetical protein
MCVLECFWWWEAHYLSVAPGTKKSSGTVFIFQDNMENNQLSMKEETEDETKYIDGLKEASCQVNII